MLKKYEELLSFGKENVEALVQSGTLAAKGYEELLKAYTAFATQSVERVQAAAKALATAKSPNEFFQLQIDLTREAGEALALETRKLAEIASTVTASAVEPLQARFQVAASLYKAAA